MATTLTHRFQKITVSGTSEQTIDFGGVLLLENGNKARLGMATVELISGSSVQLSPNAAIDSDAAAITTANPKAILDLYRGEAIRYKGGAGGEVFNISILID